MIEKNMLSTRQILILVTLFLFGSSVVIGVNINSDVGQDSWLSLIFSFVLNIPFVLILSRIIAIFPGKNIYEILDELFGKIIGKILILYFIWHTLYLGSIVLRNFSEYIEITTLSETPQLPIMICLILITGYIAKSTIDTLGRWGPIIMSIILVTVTFTLFLSIPVIEVDNLKPILNHSWKQMATSAFHVFMLPFSELIIFLGIADCFSKKSSAKKSYLYGITFTGILLLTILLRNVLVLGVPLLKSTFFSSYEAARIIKIGEFLTRIEGVITINFVLAGITKIAVFVIALSKGLAHLSKNTNYRNLVLPSCLLILGICPFLFNNVVDMFEFSSIFGLYAIPIQVVFPIIVWLFAEFKIKNKFSQSV